MSQDKSVSDVSRILLYPRERGAGVDGAVSRAVNVLRKHNVKIHLPESWVAKSTRTIDIQGVELLASGGSAELDLIVAMGGDGTFLRASRWITNKPVPVVGVNLGDLGFMAAYPSESLEVALEDAIAGRLSWEDRMRAVVQVVRNGKVLATQLASNDVYIKHGEIPRLLRLQICVREQPMAEYRADGVIVCTPLGSTGYNLAAGGPITEPGSHTFTITPICSHSLALRPVVSSADANISMTFRGPDDIASAIVTVDGQWNLPLELGDMITVRRADTPLRMVPPRKSPFAVLSHKLGWGGPDNNVCG